MSEPRELPLIFSAWKVRYILELPVGALVQTRRLMRPQPQADSAGLLWWRVSKYCAVAATEPGKVLSEEWARHAPRRVGNLVRISETLVKGSIICGRHKALYDATRSAVPCHDGMPAGICGAVPWQWTRDILPARFMPRWAARPLRLVVEDVQAQRLQEISRDDARAEGIPQTGAEASALGLFDLSREPGHEWDNRTSEENFAFVWDRLHGKSAPWSSSPWVWAYTLRVVTRDA
jgi:hypothetical protein